MSLRFPPVPLFGLFVVLCAASNTFGATLDVNAAGRLLGASGVIVDGGFYDVAFLDGTCAGLFDGCDATTDFTFQTSDAALSASQALLDQVFVDGVHPFGSQPELTAGCSGSIRCNVWTPFGFTVDPYLSLGWLSNTADDAMQGPFVGTAFLDTDLSGNGNAVFAVWTPVPEPGTALLISLGLSWLGWSDRRSPDV